MRYAFTEDELTDLVRQAYVEGSEDYNPDDSWSGSDAKKEIETLFDRLRAASGNINS